MNIDKLTLDRLAHLRLVAFFRDDAKRDMKSLGMGDDVIYLLTASSAFAKADIVAWWSEFEDYCADDMLLYLNSF